MKILNTEELCQANTIGVKVTNEKRTYRQSIGPAETKSIKRIRYLKICWLCGEPYETYTHKSYSCSKKCLSNILYVRKKGFNPPANMVEFVKPKNVKGIKEEFGYR